PSRSLVLAVLSGQRIENANRFPIAVQRASPIAEIHQAAVALEVTKRLIAVGQLQPKLSVARVSGSQALENPRRGAEMACSLGWPGEEREDLPEGLGAAGEVPARRGVLRVSAHERRADRQRVPITFGRAARIAQVGLIGVALQIAHLQ